MLAEDINHLNSSGWDITKVADPGTDARYVLHARDIRLRVELTPAEQAELARVGRLAGIEHGRRTYRLDGVDYPCDLVVPDVSLLIEAKSKVTRTHLRMAVGQVKDYDLMHVDEHGQGFKALAVLLRGRPSQSAIRYLQREQIGAIWAVADGRTATEDVLHRLIMCRWTSAVWP